MRLQSDTNPIPLYLCLSLQYMWAMDSRWAGVQQRVLSLSQRRAHINDDGEINLGSLQVALLALLDDFAEERARIIAENKALDEKSAAIAAEHQRRLLELEELAAAERSRLAIERSAFDDAKTQAMDWVTTSANRVAAAVRQLEADRRTLAGAVADKVPLSYLVAVESGAAARGDTSNPQGLSKQLRVQNVGELFTLPNGVVSPASTSNSPRNPNVQLVDNGQASSQTALDSVSAISKRRDAALDAVLAAEALAHSRISEMQKEESALAARIAELRSQAAALKTEVDAQAALVSAAKEASEFQHSIAEAAAVDAVEDDDLVTLVESAEDRLGPDESRPGGIDPGNDAEGAGSKDPQRAIERLEALAHRLRGRSISAGGGSEDSTGAYAAAPGAMRSRAASTVIDDRRGPNSIIPNSSAGVDAGDRDASMRTLRQQVLLRRAAPKSMAEKLAQRVRAVEWGRGEVYVV